MHPLRILIITDRYPPQIGGAAISAHRQAQGLAAKGYDAHVLHLTPDIEPGRVCGERDGAVMVHRLGMLEALDLTQQLAEHLAAHLHTRMGFDIFHGHFAIPAGYLAAYLGARLGVASFASVRGNDVDRGAFRADQFPFLLWTLQHAGAVGCVSSELVAKCRALSGRADIHFTPNAVDTTLFRPKPRNMELAAALNLGGEAVLGFTGELRMKKGTTFILDAFAEVAAERPAKLLLVGGVRGEDRTLLRSFLRQHPELREHLHLIDYVQERETLVDYYNLMDLVLSPSLWDGMPNSVLEAMACGRVVLASDVGGIRDAVTHGETGFLIGAHELNRLGEGCRELLAAEPAEREAIGMAARRRVEAEYTLEREMKRLEEIYSVLHQ